MSADIKRLHNADDVVWEDDELMEVDAAYLNRLERLANARPISDFIKPISKVPYPSSDITSFVIDTTAPTYTGSTIVYWTDNNTLTHQLWRVDGIHSNAVESTVGWNCINGATGSGMQPTSWGVEFYMTGDRFALPVHSYGNHDFQLIVDDQPVYASAAPSVPMHLASGETTTYIKIQFATSRTRKVWLLGGQYGFFGVMYPGAQRLWAAEPRFRVAGIGDSFWHGAPGANEGAITALTAGGQFAMQAGWAIYNLGQGGTGYSNPGTGAAGEGPGTGGLRRFGHADRMAALATVVAAKGVDLIMVCGGANDADFTTYPEATTVANANALWSAIKTAYPTVPLVVWGVESGVYVDPDIEPLNTALKNAAIAHDGVDAYIDEFEYATDWVYGTGNAVNGTGDGNRDIFGAEEGGIDVHPNHIGWEYRVRRALHEMSNVTIPIAA